MKLRSISLTNVRRFAGGSVCLDGLGDGLNLVCAPNEAGKSTFFEALEALLFVPARSAGAEARALRPYAGGAPEVAAEIELCGARFRIAKRWLQRPFARIAELPSGRVIAQDDEAEAWIAARIAAGGPAAMLWVRQGELALEPEGGTPADKAERERRARIRRDLLSSVAAEIDAVTGGRRLDAIAARAEAALAEIATATGRPKAGGRWRLAEEEAAALRDECARLDAQCAGLAAALAERAEVREALARVVDPAAARARDLALAEARRAADAAREHAARLEAASAARQVAVLERDAAAVALADHDRATGACAAAEAAAAAADAAARAAATDLAKAEAREAEAVRVADAAGARHAAVRARLAAAERAARAVGALAQAEAAEARLDRAATLGRTIAAATAEAREAGAPDVELSAARAAAARLERARDRMAAGAVSLAMRYLPGVVERATLDGRALAPGEAVDCVGSTTLELPGLGHLTVAPVGDAAAAARDAAEAGAALAAILAAAGAVDLAALADRAERRIAAEGALARATAELAGLAPEGVAALEAEAARHRAAAADADPDAPDLTDAAAVEADARAGCEAAVRTLGAAREALVAAAHVEAAAREKRAEAGRSLAAAAAAVAALPPRAGLVDELAGRHASADAAERSVAGLRAIMPDAAVALAALARAQAAVEAAAADRHRLETRDAELGALIATRADEGVEERRDEVAGCLEAAAARAAGYAAEARALSRLRDALATARAAARERYLAPVEAELRPLLALVFGEADLGLDPARLLPETLARGGIEEDLARLSGGTREQIAILTRLAFARLLARTGRATPVILDDAVVYADDDRLARILDAIAAVAADVQVILLTCRERSFEGLPATRPALSRWDAETAAAI